MLLAFHALALLFVFAEGRPDFADLIPNGDQVPNPCNTDYWSAVGHVNPSIGNPNSLNPFGEDFREAGFEWTIALCKDDSDSDGMSNGRELGDHDCTWNPTTGFPPEFDASGHPGLDDTDASIC